MCGCELQSAIKYEMAFRALLHEMPESWRKVGKLSVHAYGRCMAGNCERCAPAVSVKRGILAKERIDRGRRNGNVGKVVFTVPPRRRGRFLNRKYALAARRYVGRLLVEHGGAAYGVACFHPWGDKDRNIFAPHLDVVFVPRKGHRGYIPPEALEAMKAAWALWLETPTVSVHAAYRKGGEHGRILHACKYACRPFPGQSWKPQNAWFGRVPKVKLETRPYTCKACGQPFQHVGTANEAEYLAFCADGAVKLPRYMWMAMPGYLEWWPDP